MSESPLSTSPVMDRPKAKPRPNIPPKPAQSQDDSPSPEPRGAGGNVGASGSSGSSGKVRRIVDRFSKQGAAAGKQPSGHVPRSFPRRHFKRAPTLKPKPARTSQQSHSGGAQAPPLPAKRQHVLQRQKEAVARETESGYENVQVNGGRSEPDGKEVEIQLLVSREAEAEQSPETPPSPSCDPHCSCLCHLQWPGMKLVWVPVGTEEEDREEERGNEDAKEEERGEEEKEVVKEEEREKGGESEGEENAKTEEKQDKVEVEEEEEEVGVKVEAEVNPQVEEKVEEEVEDGEAEDELREEIEEVMAKQSKMKFTHTLDVLISEGHRRRSDPGPHCLLASLCQSPPLPPKQPRPSQFKPRQVPQEEAEEEENAYEVTLPIIDPTPMDIPQIHVHKPPQRRHKLTHSASDSMAHEDAFSSTPPAIPPRMPVCQDGRSLSPSPRAGIPLPQPTPEECRSLRPVSPNSLAAKERSVTPPSTTSLVPHRPPPPRPKADPRRLSNVSLMPVLPRAEKDENTGPEREKEDAEEEQRPVAPPRRASSFRYESRLQDEPLYQTYRATVINQEIRRQTVCRNISKTSADYAMDGAPRRPSAASVNSTGSGTLRSSPVPPMGQSTLWQDLPTVRDSGVLENLTPEQCKYQESMFEVVTSEASYLRSLRVLTEHFMDNRELENTMIIRDRKTLFSNVLRVREISERFLKDLDERVDEDLVFPDICDIIHYHAQHNFPAYVDYVRNQIYQEKTFSSLMKNNVTFATVITRLQESPQCQRLPFMSFLLLPFQRITRIKMLIENILKRTKEGTKEEQTASKALASVSKIIDECNTEVGKMKQVEELIHLSKLLEFDKLRAIPIISQTRHLEKKGELQEMSKGATLFNMRTKLSSVHFFLFNDLLIIATKKGTERFVVLDHAHRSLVQVEQVEMGSNEYWFNLTLLENHQGRMMERLVKAPSKSDMQRWLAAFPNPNNKDGEETDVIYEDWDCPQVQCVDQYIAQQADELTLEPTEIVNVLCKTNEGWCQGIRLSDGQKGWFPVGNVIEITNEHVRRRNLRERYRVIQAASIVTHARHRSST